MLQCVFFSINKKKLNSTWISKINKAVSLICYNFNKLWRNGTAIKTINIKQN